MNNVIEARGLVKEYNGRRAVKGVEFTVRSKECFGLLGPNGAGKTSIAKMIYCFSPVTAGSLFVLGMDVRIKSREIKSRLGVVSQENNLDTDLNVIENLLVYGGFFNIPKKQLLLRAKELLEFFSLSQYQDEKVDKLSGGMKRRLTIARALINSPEILILDEPTTGLDPQARHLVWQRLRRLKEQGVTLLLNTHYMEEAENLCDYLLIIDEGIILEGGKPRELTEKHIGKEVLELRHGAELLDDILKTDSDNIKGYLVVGDSLFIYATNGYDLTESLKSLSNGSSQLILRQSNLEDVFLKLTGRGLAQ